MFLSLGNVLFVIPIGRNKMSQCRIAIYNCREENIEIHLDECRSFVPDIIIESFIELAWKPSLVFITTKAQTK